MFRIFVTRFFPFLLALTLSHVVLAGPPDFSGQWNGTWFSNWDGDSGGLSATIYQSGTDLSGTVSVKGTDCPGHPDFLDLPIQDDVIVGDEASFRVSSYCQSYPIEVSITNATVSGNTMSGNYTTYVNYLTDDQGTFTMTRKTYTITASAGAGGTITPSGSVSVNAGADQTFTITPNTGYTIQDVKVDGSSVGAQTSYTFTNVQKNHTISASFSVITYTISAFAWPGGTISPSGDVAVNYNENHSFTISPDAGYNILDVKVDGSSVGAVKTFSLTNVQSDHTLVASFELDGSSCGVLRSEGFEGGVMPPNGWQIITTNSDNTWIIGDTWMNTGAYGAGVIWDDAQVQDEVLLTPVLPMASATLRFWSMGSLFWCRDTYDNCDLEIWVVVGSWDGGSGDDILLGKADDDWRASFEWSLTTFDLTQQMLGKPVRIGFRYKGFDGDLIVLDDIQICYERAFFGMPWVPLLLDD